MTPTDAAAAADRPIYVVGVDGSDVSIQGLVWAIDRAAADGATVDAVAMWHFPPVGVERPSTGQKIHAETEAMLDDAVDRARNLRPDTEVEINTAVYQFPAADRLIAMSEGADLVVVGRRARHVLGNLGSVSSRVVSHAHCPVVVIPTTAAN